MVILGVPDGAALDDVDRRCAGFRRWIVTEPDLGGERTAMAVEHAAGRLLSCLPLAMRDVAIA